MGIFNFLNFATGIPRWLGFLAKHILIAISEGRLPKTRDIYSFISVEYTLPLLGKTVEIFNSVAHLLIILQSVGPALELLPHEPAFVVAHHALIDGILVQLAESFALVVHALVSGIYHIADVDSVIFLCTSGCGYSLIFLHEIDKILGSDLYTSCWYFFEILDR